MLQAGIVAMLQADTTLRGMVGTRLYPVVMPRNASTFPAVVYQDVSATNDANLDLTSLSHKRLQFDSRGKTYADAKNIQARLHTLLDGYSGTLPDGTVVKFAESGNDIDLYDKESEIYRAVSDWVFHF